MTEPVEPPREMVRLARNAILKTDPTTQTLDEMAVTLAAEFTLVRSQAIEMCAGVVENYDWGQNYEIQSPTQHQIAVEGAIRSLR